MELFVGKTKSDLVHVNSQCSVDEVVSSLGQYVEFCLTKVDSANSGSTVVKLSSLAVEKEKALDLLMKGS